MQAHALFGDILIRLTQIGRPVLTLGVRLIAFDPEGRVFLVRHGYRPGWHLPGGAVDPGETAREAVLREAAEEGGLQFPHPPDFFHLYFFATTGRRDHIAVFRARDVLQPGAPRQPGFEIRETGFFPPDALPPETTVPTRQRISEALSETPRPDRW